jgi:hypothetical protein
MRSVEVMFPILFALAILVWMWAAVMRHVVQQFAATATPSQQWVYLAMLVMAGGAALVAILVWFMPGSPLSMGWSQERLVGLKRAAVLTAGANRCAGALAAASTNVGFQSGDPHF